MRRPHRGYTLLEVLVASTIMATAVGSLLSALTMSVRNASHVISSDRAAVLAKRTMEDLLASPLPPGQVFQGRFDPRQVALDGGWQARVELFESVPGAPRNRGIVERLVLELWWMDGVRRRTFQLEAFRQQPRIAP